jgi:hypothetical protein
MWGDVMLRFIKFLFVALICIIFPLKSYSNVSITTNSQKGIFIPVNSKISYWNDMENENYNYDTSAIILKGYRGEFEDSGVLLKFDMSRINSLNLTPDKLINAYLTLVSYEDYETSINKNYKFILEEINDFWTFFSFQNQCFYQTNTRIPCYANPKELSTNIIYNPYLPEHNIPYFMEISENQNKSGTKAVFTFNIIDTIKNNLVNNSSELSIVLKSNQLIQFYNYNENIPSIRPGIMIYYNSNNTNTQCGDNICDYNENCPSDCNLDNNNSDLEAPTITLTANPDNDKYDINDEIIFTATANDNTGIKQIKMTMDGQIICNSTTNNICSYTARSSVIGIGNHIVSAIAEDNYGNHSVWISKYFRFGSGTRPTINLYDLPEKIYPGQTSYSLTVNVNDNDGINNVTVKIGTTENENLFYENTFNLNGNTNEFNRTIDFETCNPWKYEHGNSRFKVTVEATDVENLKSSKIETRSIHYPLESIVGFKFHNTGKTLTYPEYAMTFGENEVYATFSIFWPTLTIMPGICKDIPVFMTCFQGDPDSVADALNDYSWLFERILELLGIGIDDLYEHYGVNSIGELGFPSLLGLLYYEVYRISGESGTCTGFTSSSLKILKEGNNAVREISGNVCSDVKDVTWNDAATYIGARQGAVLSAEYFHELFRRFTFHTHAIVNELKYALNHGKHPGISILGFPDADDCTNMTGHTLLVDFLIDMGSGIYRVYVYDSNKPAASSLYDESIYILNHEDINYCSYDNLPYIEINTNDNNFLYHFSNTSDWTRGCVNFPIYLQAVTGETEYVFGSIIMTLPENLLLKKDYTLPLSPNGIFMIFAANANINIQDENGHNTGVNTTNDNIIPNSAIIPLPGSNNKNFVVVLPSNKKYTINVEDISENFALSLLSDKKAHFSIKGNSGFDGKIQVTPHNDGISLNLTNKFKTNIKLNLLIRKTDKLENYLVNNLPDNLSDEMRNKILKTTFENEELSIIEGEIDSKSFDIHLKKSGLFLKSETNKNFSLKKIHLVPVSKNQFFTYYGNLQLQQNKTIQLKTNTSNKNFEVLQVNEIPDYVIPLPLKKEVIRYDSVNTPITSGNQYEIKPFSIGNLNKGKLNLKVGLPNFAGPVDIYLGIYAPAYFPNEIFLIDSNKNLVKLNEKIVPWKKNSNNKIDDDLFGEIDINTLKNGKYFLYVLVTPSQHSNNSEIPYYLWVTNFTINK